MIAFVTTCKGRAQHIEQTLPKNLTDNAEYKDCKFVILDYGSTDHLVPYLKAKHRDAAASGRLVVYSYPTKGQFRMAHAKNMAHRLGIIEGADILVNMDADNFTGPGFARYIACEFRTAENLFLWARMVRHVLPRGISGRIVVSAKAFMNAGGYDEKYSDWGRDDKDFNERLRRIGYEAREIPAVYLGGVPHNDRMRFREYQHAAQGPHGEDRPGPPENPYKTPVVNFGKFGMGTVFRNFGDAPITLGPLPTRIFGIGMHKTATTSLDTALNILGIDSAHWISAHWARAIFDEMSMYGRSRTLEMHYALSDLPIAILYEKLDRAYPGSKFILTTRSEERWLRSVRNHWDHDKNPFRTRWNKDAFTHRVHKEVYGQKGFDADIFLARYRRHNAEVREHFRNRPDDLLIMDMDNGAGWAELCGFLGKPIPAADYPKAFVT